MEIARRLALDDGLWPEDVVPERQPSTLNLGPELLEQEGNAGGFLADVGGDHHLRSVAVPARRYCDEMATTNAR